LGGERLKRKTIMVSIVALTLLLLASMLATSEAGWFNKPKPEFYGFDSKIVFGSSTIVSVDDSDAPELVIIESYPSIVDCNITIDDKVYYYPDDFDFVASHHMELNPVTGNALVRSEGTFVFKMAGRPTLSFWGMARVTGWHSLPDGSLLAPENVLSQGEFELTGTKKLSQVEGFGLGDGNFVAPDYANMYIHQLGFIKGWSR